MGACAKGNLNVVQFLLQRGFDMNIGNNDGTTGFHLACAKGDLKVVQFLLLQQGFDMNVRDNNGKTGFYAACFCGQLNMVQFLIHHVSERINELDVHYTGLQCLIHKRHNHADDELLMPCILLLIEAGAALNENDVFDKLISALQNRIIEIVFMKKIIFEKWTGRIAQVITDFTIHPFTNTSLQNLYQHLNWNQNVF